MLLRQARAEYFERNGFGERGGYDSPWVHVRFLGLPLAFPNTKGRVRAVRYHDLHHVLTGYATDMLGEYEISAWELGAGCGRFIVAWQINLGALFAGMLLAPRRTLRGYVRGRRSKPLYASRYRDYDALLDRSVDEVRAELGIDREPARLHGRDLAVLAPMVVAGAVLGAAFLVLMAASTPIALALARFAETKSASTPGARA